MAKGEDVGYTLRLSESLHRKLKILAAIDGVSLNQFLIGVLSQEVERRRVQLPNVL